jgi:hypothetical protein
MPVNILHATGDGYIRLGVVLIAQGRVPGRFGLFVFSEIQNNFLARNVRKAL